MLATNYIYRIHPLSNYPRVSHTRPFSTREFANDPLCGIIQLALALIPTLILLDCSIEFRCHLLNINVHLYLALFRFGFNVEQVTLKRLVNTN